MPVKGQANGPRIGLVLGSGAARGWSQLGVIEELETMGIMPDVITGCSIGAVVGGFYAAGKLDELRGFADGLTMLKMAEYFDITWNAGGVIGGHRLISWFDSHFEGALVEDLPVTFGAVAADIRTGREIWLREGRLTDAIRASIALPGLLTPWPLGGRWLTDGGLVNPVPISLARAMEADVVIAVDLNAGVFRFDGGQAWDHKSGTEVAEPGPGNWLDDLAEHLPKGLQESTRKMLRELLHKRDRGPQQYEVINNAVAIMSDRITKARIAGEPPDVMLTPDLASIGAMQFYKAEEAIEAGRRATRLMQPAILAAIGYSASEGVEKKSKARRTAAKTKGAAKKS